MEKATIYGYARMCRTYHTNCPACPMWNEVCTFCIMDNTQVDKANEIILKWCKEHPVKTRQGEFLEMFPNAEPDTNGAIGICPLYTNKNLRCKEMKKGCKECKKSYWLAEVEE